MNENVKQVENIIKFLQSTKEVLSTEEISNISSACIGAIKRIKGDVL